jgi:mono/diheme cytochrome c family protein
MKPAWVLPAFLLLLPGRVLAAEPIDYLRDVKPIIARHCYACHGPDKQRSGLRLDTSAAAHKGGNNGPAVVPGKSASSRLIQAVTAADDVPVMPPKEPRLSKAEIAMLRAWIDAGAHAPADEVAAQTATKSKHWAFQPPVHPIPPAVKGTAWLRNPIDRFILARLEKEGVGPSPEAGRATLIRRLSLDLLGLPPTDAEVESFIHDERPDAYERLVDRLLASPHYGERWGRFWLDGARYADSNGYSIDAPRSIWPYRDWVINALNRDMPFDRFTIEQIAGDLLPDATLEQKIATGFHRNTMINQEGGINLEQFRVESLVDRVNTTGTVFLGLTIGCCQCHDHKYDPITQREYYEFFAFLNNVDEPTLELPTAEQLRQREEFRGRLAEVEKRLQQLDMTTPAQVDAWEHRLTPEDKAKLPANIQAILAIAENGRDAKQKEALAATFRKTDEVRHAVGGLADPLPFLRAAHALAARQRTELHRQIAELKKRDPQIVSTLVVQERKTPRETHVLLGGDFTRPGAAVMPGLPAALRIPPPPAPPPQGGDGSKTSSPPSPLVGEGGRGGEGAPNRLDLARWLVDPANPLTARVTMNRLWQNHFGLGLVETDNDFGTQGTPPSHPELLDWLATEFIARGWSLKAMHRLVVTSATYRQSSRARSDLANLDPRNRLLARQSRLRLEAEVVRDVALAASGLLSEKMGGPSVFPPQPEGVYRFTQVPRDWKPSAGPDRFRRGLYTHFWRSAPYPALLVFDAPESNTTCTRRNRSNTPLQALTLLNDQAFYEFAQALARRVLAEAQPDEESRLRLAFHLCLARSPSPLEESRLGQLLTSAEAAQDVSPPAGVDARAFAAWTTVARVLLNLDEFITRE